MASYEEQRLIIRQDMLGAQMGKLDEAAYERIAEAIKQARETPAPDNLEQNIEEKKLLQKAIAKRILGAPALKLTVTRAGLLDVSAHVGFGLNRKRQVKVLTPEVVAEGWPINTWEEESIDNGETIMSQWGRILTTEGSIVRFSGGNGNTRTTIKEIKRATDGLPRAVPIKVNVLSVETQEPQIGNRGDSLSTAAAEPRDIASLYDLLNFTALHDISLADIIPPAQHE